MLSTMKVSPFSPHTGRRQSPGLSLRPTSVASVWLARIWRTTDADCGTFGRSQNSRDTTDDQGAFRLFGRRVFRMAPLHHHFEMLGWEQVTIVIRFWILSAAGQRSPAPSSTPMRYGSRARPW